MRFDSGVEEASSTQQKAPKRLEREIRPKARRGRLSAAWAPRPQAEARGAGRGARLARGSSAPPFPEGRAAS